jgi:aspartate aminotransferase
LNSLRQEFERLTLEIIGLAGKRTNLVEEIAVEKIQRGLTLVNREVERNLRIKVVEQCVKNDQNPEFALRLVNQLIMESISKQESHFEKQEFVSAYDIFVKANNMEREGREVIHLEVGEPDFGPPVAVAESLTKAVVKGHGGYTQSSGILALRQKIVEYVNQKHDQNITADQVIITVGGRFAIYLSLVTSLRPGDEVIVIDPSYPAYSDCIKQAGGRPVHITTQLADKWNLNLNQLEESINQTTKMIILNSPNSPSGKTLDDSTLEKIAELSLENDIRIVSDEVYSEFSLEPHVSILQFPCNQIYVNSFSKTFGMTGFRLGYAISDAETIQKITKLQNISLTCVPEFIQYAGITALDCLNEAEGYVNEIKIRQAAVSKRLESLPVSFYRPDGGFYLFPRLNNETTNGSEFAERLLMERRIAVVPGTAYGKQFSQFFRISVCQPVERLMESVNRMEEILE